MSHIKILYLTINFAYSTDSSKRAPASPTWWTDINWIRAPNIIEKKNKQLIIFTKSP